MITVLIQFEHIVICRQPDRLTSSICSALAAGALFTRLQPLASVASCLETDDLLDSWPARIFGCSRSSFLTISSPARLLEAIRGPLSNLPSCKEHRSCLSAAWFSSLCLSLCVSLAIGSWWEPPRKSRGLACREWYQLRWDSRRRCARLLARASCTCRTVRLGWDPYPALEVCESLLWGRLQLACQLVYPAGWLHLLRVNLWLEVSSSPGSS